MSSPADQAQAFKIIAVVAGILGVIIYAVYQNAQIQRLRAKLMQSQFQVQKDQNAQAVKSESDSALIDELDQDVKGGGPSA